jgi:hypothetical protein
MIHEQYRQGDVLLVRVASLPCEAKPEPASDQSVILAYGEVTGHAHRLSSQGVTLYSFNDDRLLEVRQPSDLTHEEHAPLKIEPGIYKVVRQREYTPQNVRLVSD